MRISCLSCRREINLDHPVFHNYQGTVKCFACGKMMDITTIEGALSQSSLWSREEVIILPASATSKPAMRSQMKAN
jgi:hypothetical protein